jgi:dTDP-4-amino-4,6-dideoxygalactose transaminase
MENRPIKFIDLAKQQKLIYSRLQSRINNVLSHGQYIMGPEVAELEEKLAKYAGVKHAVSCSSGTDALLMALMAYGISPGDTVFTTPFTFIATAEVIALLGATPVFVDIDPRTYNLDPVKLELAIRAVKENNSNIHPLPNPPESHSHIQSSRLNPKGVICVDLFGLPADYDSINVIARKHSLFVAEDAAQSFGSVYKGRKAGALTDVAATSFFPAKPLGCYGDGGAVLTDDDNLALKLNSIRQHGKGTEKYDNVRIGINGRLDTIQAAVLIEKLEVFPKEVEARNRIADRYSNGLKESVQIPFIPPNSMSVWAQYSILVENRDNLQQCLAQAKIPTMIYYPKPLHLQGAFTNLGYRPGDFPVSERTSQAILSLPMHPYLEDDEIDMVIDAVAACSTRQNESEKPE